MLYVPGVDPGFQVRGGGGLKKNSPSGGRRENCLGISFLEKIMILRQKIIFSNFKGGACRVCPPLDPPLRSVTDSTHITFSINSILCLLFVHDFTIFSVSVLFIFNIFCYLQFLYSLQSVSICPPWMIST